MEGYAARQGASLGIHDPLLGQLLLLEAGGRRLALICLDLLGVSLDFTSRVRRGIAGAIGVPADHTLLACSHTHSGPAGFLPRLPGISSFEDPDLQLMAVRKLVRAAIRAERSLRPARLGCGSGSVDGLGLNRNDPQAGLLDREVIVLRVEDEAGAPLAVMMNHACHPTVLGAANRLFSADFPGAARSALRRLEPGAIFLFTNGAAGDVSTRFTRREQSFDEVERLGRLLAGEVLKVMQAIATRPEAELSAATLEVELKLRPFPPPEAARLAEARLQAELKALEAAGAPHGEIRRAFTRLEGAAAQARLGKEFAGKSSLRSQVQRLSIGDLAIVGLLGEPFTRTGLAIKAASPKPFTAVVAYANDYAGYFPDAPAFEADSYEALISPYSAEAAEALQQAALGLLREERHV